MRTSRLYSPSVIILSLSSMIENLALGLPLSYFPYYAMALGAPLAYIGFFMAAFTASSVLFYQRFGTLSDRIGRKKLIQAGLLADAVLGTLTGLIGHWGTLLIIRILNGVASAAVWPSAQASLVDQTPENRRGEALGFYLTLGMLGANIGPLFGGVVQSFSENTLKMSAESSYRIPFFVDSLLSLIAFALVMLGVRETREKAPQKATVQQEEVKLSKTLSLSLNIIFISGFATGFSLGLIIPISVLYFGDILNATELQISIILTISGLVGMSCNLYAGRLSDKIGRKPILALGGIPARLASIALPFAPNLAQATGLMVFGSFVQNVSMPAGQALAADLIPSETRGRLFGRLGAFYYLGMIVGPILGTWVYAIYSPQVFKVAWLGNLAVKGAGVPFFVSSAVGLTGLLLTLVLVEEPRRKSRSPAASSM